MLRQLGTNMAAIASTITAAITAKADWVTPEQYGAVGDGVTDDTAALKSAATSGKNVRATNGKTYLVTDTITLGSNRTYDFNWATLKAGTGMTAKPVVSVSNVTFFGLSNLYIDGNSNALHGLYASHANEATSIIEHVNVHNAIQDGVNLVGCQASSVRSVRSTTNGRYGVYLESCNALVLRDSTIEANTSDGVYVAKGATNFSSGCTITDNTIQTNGGNGVNIVDATSTVRVKNNWLELNTLNGVLSAAKASVTDNYITLTGTGSNFAINLASTARGVYKNNTFGSSGGSPAKVKLDNTGLTTDLLQLGLDIEPNFLATSGAVATPSLSVSRAFMVLRDQDFYYHAAKSIDVSTTASYTAILTAPISTSVEVTIYSAENSNGAFGQTIVKTWSSMNNDTRNSFGEVGSTNAFTNGAFYNPVYLTGKGLFVRWTGNNLEIKPESSASNLWVVEVKAMSLSANQRVTWLV